MIKPICNRWAAWLEQVRNAPPSETVESDYDKIAQQRYKYMEAFEGNFFKLEHCWDMLKDCEKLKLIDKESPLKRGSPTNEDGDEDDDGPRNLNKPDGDKKTKEKIKREHEASILRDKIDTMEEGLRKAAIEERRARAAENKAMSKLLAEENRIMTLNRNDMDDITKEWHDMARRDILKRRMLALAGACYSAGDGFLSGFGTNMADAFSKPAGDLGAGVGTCAGDGFQGGDDLNGGGE
ncbi:hypothetical protein VPH35_094074 [Triticum aestivum]